MTNLTYGVDLAAAIVEPAQIEFEVATELTSEIQSLWSDHQLTKATAKHSKEELKTLRLHLGQKLCLMKATLARTGRSGGWAAYLRSV